MKSGNQSLSSGRLHAACLFSSTVIERLERVSGTAARRRGGRTKLLTPISRAVAQLARSSLSITKRKERDCVQSTRRAKCQTVCEVAACIHTTEIRLHALNLRVMLYSVFGSEEYQVLQCAVLSFWAMTSPAGGSTGRILMGETSLVEDSWDLTTSVRWMFLWFLLCPCSFLSNVFSARAAHRVRTCRARVSDICASACLARASADVCVCVRVSCARLCGVCVSPCLVVVGSVPHLCTSAFSRLWRLLSFLQVHLTDPVLCPRELGFGR